MKKKWFLKEKMLRNWDSITDFVETSGIPVSMETVRRAVNHGRPVSIPSLLLIAKYLGFSIPEIKQILQNAGDTDFSALIVDQETHLSVKEEALIEIYRKLKSSRPIEDYLALLAKADKVNIKKELSRLKRKGGK